MPKNREPVVLVSWPWWRDLAERAARQMLQTAGPILAAVVAAQGHVDLTVTVLTLAGAAAVTGIKFVLNQVGVVPPAAPGSGLLVVIVDRAVPAFAGALLPFIPESWAGLVAMHWRDDMTAAAAAAILAVVMTYVVPPTPDVVVATGARITR